VSGKQIQRTLTFRADGPQKAARAAKLALAQLERQADEERQAIGTVADLCVRYERHKLAVANWSPSHADRQHDILAVIAADLGRIRLADLSAIRVDEWFSVLLGRGLKPTTVAPYHETLRAMLRQGDKWDMCTARAAEKATGPVADTREVVAPTNPVVALLLEQARGALRVSLFIAALAGLRRGEIMGLRWSDFDGWDHWFFRPLIERVFDALKPGGVFALQIGNQTYPLGERARIHADRIGFEHVETRHSGMRNNYHDTPEDKGEVIEILRKPA
jgi:integrase